MRLSVSDLKTLGSTVSFALTTAFYDGRKEALTVAKVPGSSFGYDPAGPMNELLQSIDQAGFDIIKKAAARPGEPIEIKLPDGSIHGYYHAGAAPTVGTVALLTPEGERLIQAVADADYSTLSERQLADVSDLRDRLSGIGNLVFGVIERPITPEDCTGLKLEPGKADEAPAVTRDLVLFNCEDYEGNAAAAEALGLDSYPLEDPVTLGWLVDEHAAFKQALETLIWDLTNGCVSKPNTDLDIVHQLAGQVFVVNLLEDHPELAADPLFRPAMEKHFTRGEIEAQVEIARRRLDGHRVVRIGAAGTFDLGKVEA